MITMKTFMSTVVLGLLCFCNSLSALEEADIIGVWKTIDASNDQGREIEIIVFQENGKAFIPKLPYDWDVKKQGTVGDMALVESIKSLGICSKGKAQTEFVYSIGNLKRELELTIVKFNGLEVESSTIAWEVIIEDNKIRLKNMLTQDWLELEKLRI